MIGRAMLTRFLSIGHCGRLRPDPRIIPFQHLPVPLLSVIEGAVHRLRPKLLTEGVRVLGGLLISDEVVDIFLPVRFYWVRRARWLKLQAQRQAGKTVGAQAGQGTLVAALVS